MRSLYVNAAQVRITESNAQKLLESGAILQYLEGGEFVLNPEHNFVLQEVEILANPKQDYAN